MPAYVRHADARHEHFELPLVKDGIGKSYFIRSSWADMKAILKAVILTNPSKFIRITSDREIRDVGVGSTGRAARGADETDVYNNLEDIMGPPALCVVRLGELLYKNKAAAGLLEEALCYRLDRDLPTWVVSDLDRPFGRGSNAFSDSVWDLLRTAMKDFLVPRIAPAAGPDEPNSALGPSPAGERSPLAPEPVAGPAPRRRPDPPPGPEPERPRRRIQPVPDEDAPKGLGEYGMGLGPSKKFQKRGD